MPSIASDQHAGVDCGGKTLAGAGDTACAKSQWSPAHNAVSRVPEWPGVYAVGDCAAIPHPGRPGNFYGPTAQNGLRQGKRAGRNILRTLRGQALLPFRYRELGQLAAIGQRRGVANVLGFHFSGFLAWWLWRMVYLWKLPGIARKSV